MLSPNQVSKLHPMTAAWEAMYPNQGPVLGELHQGPHLPVHILLGKQNSWSWSQSLRERLMTFRHSCTRP